MLIQIAAALGPLKLVLAGLLFLNLAWIAVRKWLVIGALAVSVVEIAMPDAWAHMQTFGATPLMRADGSWLVDPQAITAIVLANALLAGAIWFAVRGLQLWARATVRRHQQEFLALIEREEHYHGV
ncbi:hypothetical protein [Solimonas terrae]|uniref:Uncharacterized protein n=1 Tax=Solimonas terrae TaxID=1396819 RepID=A0A6M2BR03_9GAMM|nr:hypothetical protein [Solimonas terrae]NGY04750.1 hypothetical protein [Solimonas terrae]